jgi:hypothetical protein
MKESILFIMMAATLQLVSAQRGLTGKTGSWGDQGNGTFINPVLNADYSDPDVIRVGDDFYMVCSKFKFA